MEDQPKVRKEKKPPTERQAFSTWLLGLVVVGIGVGVAICGLNGVVNKAVGDDPPGPVEFLVVGALVVFVGALLLRGVPKGLKPFDRFAKDKTAVSPVIAVILMVAITVVLAAVVFVLVSDIGSQVGGVPPNVGFAKEGDGLQVVSIDRPSMWGDFAVSGCSGVPDGNETVDAGDRVTGCTGDVVVVHRPSNSIVYRTEF
jgi:flagellin-like protein